MNIDKSYFLSRLANGESIDTIGNDIAAMMNAAMEDHKAMLAAEAKAKAEADKEAAKHALCEEMIEIIKELAILDGVNTDVFDNYTEDDVDDLAKSISATFKTLVALQNLCVPATPVTVSKKSKSDDEILADFLASLL